MAIDGRVRTAGRIAAALVFPLLLSPARAAVGAPADTPPARELREDEVPAYPTIPSTDPVVGRIEIPSVGISAVILQGVDDATIRRAVGHFPETPMPGQPGNMALAAHRTTDFYGLRNIHPGDEVSIVSARGTFRYQVEKTWVVTPEDVSVLDPSTERVLTLVTCFPFDYRGSAPERFIVRARSIDPPPPSPPRPVAPPLAKLPPPVPLDQAGLLLLAPVDPKPAT